MGDQLSNARYRRATPPPRQPPGRLPTGRRLKIVIGGLVVLAVLAVVALVVGNGGGDDDPAAAPGSTGTTAASSTTGTGPASDEDVARSLLPATLGQGWVESDRQADPVPAEVDTDDACATAGQPIQQGLIVRVAFDHLTTEIVERASLVAGVVTPGTPVPRLDDPPVTDCLREGLTGLVSDGAELVDAPIDLPPAPDGAELTGARFEVHRDGTVAGRFDMVLLRRDRAVTFILIAVQQPDAATPLADVVRALDAPLVAGAARLH